MHKTMIWDDLKMLGFVPPSLVMCYSTSIMDGMTAKADHKEVVMQSKILRNTIKHTKIEFK